jgi:hypothetical protein
MISKQIIVEARKKYKYDEKTGNFYWAIKPKNGNKSIGDLAGSIDSNGYLTLRVFNKIIKAHRLAWAFCYGNFPNKVIDHINHIKTDNRIHNLRDVSNAENLHNPRGSQINNKLNLLNIRKKQNKYVVQINKAQKRFHIGVYKTINDALRARDISRILLGLNIPENNNVYC